MSSRAIAFVTLAALSISLSACDQVSPPTAPAQHAGMVTAVSPASLIERDATPSIPYQLEGAQWVPCAAGGQGEYILTSGLINYRLQIVTDAVGNEHVKVHANSQRLTGVGTITGDTYRGSLRENRSALAFVDGAFSGRLEETYHFVAPGQENNFTLRFVLRIVVDANGTTVVTDDVRAVCG